MAGGTGKEHAEQYVEKHGRENAIEFARNLLAAAGAEEPQEPEEDMWTLPVVAEDGTKYDLPVVYAFRVNKYRKDYVVVETPSELLVNLDVWHIYFLSDAGLRIPFELTEKEVKPNSRMEYELISDEDEYEFARRLVDLLIRMGDEEDEAKKEHMAQEFLKLCEAQKFVDVTHNM